MKREFLKRPYEAPHAVLRHIHGQNMLKNSSFLLDEGLEEGDKDTFEEFEEIGEQI